MVKSNIISAMKANRLYWLGRYEERVYLTLHLLRKCYDKMIDGDPKDYETFWQKLDVCNTYKTTEDFQHGMMFDEDNISSVLSAQLRAQDNAILLREDITSETLSYIEMSIALMRRLKAEHAENITKLQPVTDWALAFWGSAPQRMTNNKAMVLLYLGRRVEHIDFLLRYNYPLERIMMTYHYVAKYLDEYPDLGDSHLREKIEELLDEREFTDNNVECRNTLLKYINQLIRV